MFYGCWSRPTASCILLLFSLRFWSSCLLAWCSSPTSLLYSCPSTEYAWNFFWIALSWPWVLYQIFLLCRKGKIFGSCLRSFLPAFCCEPDALCWYPWFTWVSVWPHRRIYWKVLHFCPWTALSCWFHSRIFGTKIRPLLGCWCSSKRSPLSYSKCFGCSCTSWKYLRSCCSPPVW